MKATFIRKLLSGWDGVLMVQLVYEQLLGPGFSDRFEVQVADTDDRKGIAYQLRSRAENVAKPHAQIDAYDAYAHHLLLLDRASQQALATTRLIPRNPGNKRSGLPVEQRIRDLSTLADMGLLGNIPKLERQLMVSELSVVHVPLVERVAAEAVFNPELIAQGLTLAAYALARMLFHDYMLTELDIDRFKKVRANGLQFEYASGLADGQDDSAIFYLDLNQEIKSSSPFYDLYQSFSNQIAPQLNMPDLSETGN